MRTLLAVVALVGAAAPAAAGQETGPIDNPWFPLRPGTTFVYRGLQDGQPTRDVVTVTRRTRVIAGARCIEVDDRLYSAGRLRERTADWYAQDRNGNVWYYGERTAELDAQGHVTSTEGSWLAGVDGARAGIFMPARPRVGATFGQEHYAGHAEDKFRILSLDASVSTPAATSRSALLTKEWTPLEPGVVDHKLYVRNVGLVKEETVQGGNDRGVLVSVTRG